MMNHLAEIAMFRGKSHFVEMMRLHLMRLDYQELTSTRIYYDDNAWRESCNEASANAWMEACGAPPLTMPTKSSGETFWQLDQEGDPPF